MNSSTQSSCTAPERQPQSSTTLLKASHAPQTPERVLSWGRYPRTEHRQVYKPAWNDQIPEILKTAAAASLLPFGLGRSYGDSCLNAGRDLINCHRLNRILGFDESAGVVRCESGVNLSDLLRVFLPKGWFLPVTPGTSFVTVGGAIANDTPAAAVGGHPSVGLTQTGTINGSAVTIDSLFTVSGVDVFVGAEVGYGAAAPTSLAKETIVYDLMKRQAAAAVLG